MRTLIAFILVASSCAFAQNLTTVTAANIQKAGAPLASGTLCFTATDANDAPIGFRIGGGGQEVIAPYCAVVTNGAIAGFQVANPANTSPANIEYRIEVFDQYTRVLKYAGVQFSGATFNLDNYVPSANLPLGTSVNVLSVGNLTVTGSCSGCALGSGYNLIQIAGSALAQRLTLNFVSGVSCSDNPGQSRTDCTVSGGGSGTVTGVSSDNFSPLFNVNVATNTTTPAFSFAAINQAANQVYAGPASGVAAAPGFRALVSADIPANAANTSGNAATATALAATPAQCGANMFATGIAATAAANCAQPAFSNLSGSATKPQLPATTVYTDQSNSYSAGTQDFSGAAHTLPALKGLAAAKPATCTVGELYFATDATAGQNIYECAATNTWTQQLNSGGGGLSANQPIMPVGTNTAPAESGSTTSLNPITPTNTANGDLEVMWVGFNSATPGTITPPTGWTAVPSCSASGNGVQINAYSHTASSEGSNTGLISWVNSVGAAAVVTSYRNAAIDVCSATTSAAASSFSVPSLTAAATSDRIIAVTFQGGGSGNITRGANLAGDLIEQFQAFFAMTQVSYPITNTTVATRSFNSMSNPWAGFQLALSFSAGTTAGPQGALTFNQHNAALGSLVLSDACTGSNPVFGPFATCGIQLPNGVPIWFIAGDGHPLGESWIDSASNFHIGATDGQRVQIDSGNLDVGDNSGGGVLRNGNGISQALGNKYECTHGTNATCGVATLAGGTVTVSTTAIGTLATSGASGFVVELTLQTCSSCGILSIGTVSNGTSFVIHSSNTSDASLVYWEIKYVN